MNRENPARDLLSNVFGAYFAKGSDVVHRSLHDATVQAAKDCKAAWTQYTDVMYEHIAEAASTVDASLAAWTENSADFASLLMLSE